MSTLGDTKMHVRVIMSTPTGGCSVHRWDTMSTPGVSVHRRDTMSTLGVFSTPKGYH